MNNSQNDDNEILKCAMQAMEIEFDPSADPNENLFRIMNHVQFDNDTVIMPGCIGDIINLTFKTTRGATMEMRFPEDAKIKDVIKKYFEKNGLNVTEELSKKIIFLYNGGKIDIKSEEQIKKVNLKDNKTILVKDIEGIIKNQS